MGFTSLEGRLQTPPRALIDTSLVEYLDKDRRPTFAINFRSPNGPATDDFDVVYANDAFRKIADEFADLLDLSAGSENVAFRTWVKQPFREPSLEYHRHLWSAVTVSSRCLILSGTPVKHARSVEKLYKQTTDDQQMADEHPARDSTNGHAADAYTRRAATFLYSSHAESSELCHLIREFDWGRTTLGPITEWHHILDHMIPVMIKNPIPCCIFWGPDRTIIYNDSYANMMQNLHPAGLGSSAKVSFASFWPPFEEMIEKIEANKQAVRFEGMRVVLNRTGKAEEAMFNCMMVPLLDEAGGICGVLSEGIEVTKEIVTHSQMNTLIKIANGTTFKTTLQDFWDGAFASIQSCTADLSFALVYTLDEADLIRGSTGSRSSSRSEVEKWHLRGSAGLPEGHPVAPKTLDLSTEVGLAPALRQVPLSEGQTFFDKSMADLPSEFSIRPSDHLTGPDFSRFVVCPLSLCSDTIVGYVVFGLHQMRPYDDEYAGFVNLLARQIEDAATSVVLLEREKQHLQKTVEQAEQQRVWLADQLEIQTREARQSELRFHNFSEQAPVGVYIVGSDGVFKYCNEAFCNLVGMPRGAQSPMAWRKHVHPDDVERVDEQWQSLKEGKVQVHFEWRALKQPDTAAGRDQITYLRSSAFPELAEDGSMQSVTGICMDVSVHKAHEKAIADRLTNALDAKRAQENFMDMVSHEMRNPLNAMLQCAEEASEIIVAGTDIAEALEVLDTIRYCGRHQKQIIDDVLTISKLDSNLLKLCPDEATPLSVLDKVAKIFRSEIRAADINVVTNASQTCRTPFIMDANRVLQILINLVGNAVKFMKDSPTRKLILSVETSQDKPCASNIKYGSSGRQRDQSTTSANWGGGVPVYVQYSVTDTGPGLTAEEMDTLFARFKQASPRTHAQYGGSGLGLFISRELAEMHGGEIGLTSIVNQGSTFAFYIKGLAVPEKASSKMTMIKDVKPVANRSHGLLRSQYQVSPNDITILIVEDNLVNQRVLQRQLNKLGYKTSTANQGQEALDTILGSQWQRQKTHENALHLSIVLCDLEMPVMDGLTCVKHIRELQNDGTLDAHIPMVAVTGNARSEQVNTALAAGFDRVVSKPYSVPDLQPLIAELVQASPRPA